MWQNYTKQTMKTRILQFETFILILVVLFSSVAGASTVALDKVIAIVNDEAITLSEYQTRYKREQVQTNQGVGQVPEKINPDILRLLIDERIQAQEARSAGIVVGQPDVENVLTNMANQNNLSTTQLLTELETQGISNAQFLRSIEEQLLIQRVVDIAVNSRVTVTEQEVDYYLRAHKEASPSDEAYEISHLFISTDGKSAVEIEAEIENVNYIHQQLLQGHAFVKAVEDFSDGENTEEGGYLGWRTENQLPELFLNVLHQTPVGNVTEVIKSANGFHILKLHDKKGSGKIVTQLLVRHILIQPQRHNFTDQEAIQKLIELAEKINHEGDFEKFARLTSDDTVSASAGGSLGWVSPDNTAPLFEQAILNLPLNQISKPVKSRFGYHLIEVLDRRQQDIGREITRNNARNDLFKRKAKELYQNWFNRLRDRVYIEHTESN